MATSQKKTGKKTGSTAAKKRPAAKSGTKKNTTAKGRQTKAQVKEAEQRQMGAVILFGVALLMLCIAFIPGGGAWGALQQFFFGCFGIGFYIWPFVLAYVAFMASLQKDYRNLKVQVAEVAIFIWLICTAVFIGYNAEDMVGGFDQAIKEAYQAGGVHTNGGVFGAVLGGLFLLITGNAKTPAMVVTIILILLVLMLLTGTTLNRLANNIATPVKKAGETESLVEVKLETGRTHQIRVHFASLGTPLVGDSLYGTSLPEMQHQALHCGKATFVHPYTGEEICLEAPFPADFVALLDRLESPDVVSKLGLITK